jgi:hypothetical protein
VNLGFHLRHPQGLVKRGYARAKEVWTLSSPAGRSVMRSRAETDRILDGLARQAGHHFDGTVLIDGMWDNPNYWLRFALLRAGLGLAQAREVGLLGKYRRSQVRATLRSFGVREIADLYGTKVTAQTDAITANLLAGTKTADDVLQWELPGQVHPALFYDAVLKLQRRASACQARPP